MYGLMIPDSTDRDIQRSTAGFVAYEYFITHAAVRIKAIDIINQTLKVKSADDMLIEDIFSLLIDDLEAHDYDEDRAFNESAGVQMSIENYILQRLKYAVSSYMRKEQSNKTIEVVTTNGTTKSITTQTVSLEAPLSNDEGSATLGEVVPDATQSTDTVAFDAVGADKAIAELVERIARLASWSDTNIDVVIYTVTSLELQCDEAVDRSEVWKQALTALGITNYESAKQLMHNEDCTEIFKDVASIENKQLFLDTLEHQIFCIKEIKATVNWIADEANKKAIIA